MNDKAIRNILIAYLKASNHEIRFYQEKSIGTSICDVMAVTDSLTGYEIKSDLDNYSRLAGQIKAYDRFFDEYYLVVSKSHCQSAQYHVPNHWGILCIENDNITLFREALGNQQVSRRNQLTILWKLELKNLLVRNNMPLYAQRDRKYISEQLASTVEPGLLGRQITRELLQRDYSVYDAQDHTLYYNDGEGFPAEEIVDMLSEKNLEQMTLDLDVFDNWVKTFALPEQLCEIDVDTSKFRFVRRFSKFFNLPELSRMFSQIAIFHAMDDTEEMPKLESYVQCSALLFLLNTAIVPAPVGLERQRHLIRQRICMANPGINFRCAVRGIQVDDGFSVPQLYPPTGKVVVWHPAGKGMRKRFPKPPMIVADCIDLCAGNGKAQQFSVHIPEQPSFRSHLHHLRLLG